MTNEPTGVVAPAGSRRNLRHFGTVIRFLKSYGIATAFFVLCIALSIVSDYFLELSNILDVLRQTSINGILAIGMVVPVVHRRAPRAGAARRHERWRRRPWEVACGPTGRIRGGAVGGLNCGF
jgi:hypothetical protein